MVISDKQALRRCVKQAVRRAEVVESMLDFDILHGVLGVKPLLSMAVQPFEGTPLGENAVAASAAMDALEMPFGDPAPRGADSKRIYAGCLPSGDSRCHEG